MKRLAALACLLLLSQPALAADWLERCEAGIKAGDAAACERALEQKPDDPEILRRLGNAYFHADRFLESHRAYQAALRAAPNDAGLHYEYASLLVLINEYHEGVREAEAAVKLAPDHRLSWALLATCYRMMKRPDQAIKATQRAASLGDRREAYTLAHAYGDGSDGLRRDPKQEARWLERAALAGHVAAMDDLAELFAKGRPGIPADTAKSRYWHERAMAALR